MEETTLADELDTVSVTELGALDLMDDETLLPSPSVGAPPQAIKIVARQPRLKILMVVFVDCFMVITSSGQYGCGSFVNVFLNCGITGWHDGVVVRHMRTQTQMRSLGFPQIGHAILVAVVKCRRGG